MSGPGATRRRASPLWLLVPSVFALAFFSPVEYVDSDPGIALLASQAILDHGTLRLDAYAGDPGCAYDLEHDYRIRRRGGSLYYFSPGVPVLSLPAVWLANLAGAHMLDQDDERALQNLLSALCCALLAVPLYGICSTFVGTRASLVITAVSLLGSSLVSTLATALWNACYEILLLALGLLHLVRRRTSAAEPSWGYLTLLAGLAFFCRPTAAFAAAGLAVAATPLAALRRKRTWLLLALAALLVAVLVAFDAAQLIPRYYSPLKLTPATPLLTGLDGVLLSPSRGLLVFSPFLVPVAAGALRFLPELAGSRLFRLAAAWSGLHLLAVATKGYWWGGYSYGPRLLAEVMLPAVVTSCLVWRLAERRTGRRTRRVAAAVYLVIGLGAVFIHSYQGLFNPYTREWNGSLDIDTAPEAAFDWRYPQFLASERSLEERLLEVERRDLAPYVLGEELAYDSGGALFRGWYGPETGWRWSRGSSAEIVLLLGDLPGRPGRQLYLWRLRAGALGAQSVDFEVNGVAVGRIELDGHRGRERAFAFEGDLLQPGAENRFRFEIPGAAATAGDPRRLGMALYAFELRPLAPDFAGVGFADEPLFVHGFSAAEAGWRWTDGRRAAIDYPVRAGEGLSVLELEAGAAAEQSVGIRLNGVELGELAFPAGFTAVTRRLAFDPALLRPSRMNRIELALPGAERTADDERLLGIAFVRLRLLPED